jgi:hypothetical protein
MVVYGKWRKTLKPVICSAELDCHGHGGLADVTMQME